ncbi:MAG: FAD-dependent oxidoreductase [Christensenellales bacterium]|jgi:flavocytochrome c
MKHMLKKGLALLMTLAMLASFAACAAQQPADVEATPSPAPATPTGKYTDGTYTGSAYGMNGEVPVTVVVENGMIVSVTVGEHSETPGIGTAAAEQLPEAIIAAQSADVDTVSGATITSNAILKAVKIALGLEKVEGGEVSGETSADVIVVGAGLAGLVAAYQSARLGATVILFEQSGAVGGSSRYAGGYVSGANTKLQKAAGMEDTAELAYQDMINIGGAGNFTPELAWMHVQRAGEMVDWIVDHLEVPLSEPGFGAYTPTNVPRVSQTATGGIEFANAMKAKIEECVANGSVTLLLNTKVDELTNDAAGAVNGVVANGVTYEAKSVILATGGYGYNEEWVKRYNFKNSRSQAPVTAIGSGYDLAEAQGASFSNMEYLPAYPGAVDTSEDTYSTTVLANVGGWSGAIWVDKQGSRMVDEVDFTVAARQSAWENAEDNYVYILFTKDMMDSAEAPLFNVDATNGNWDRFNAELAEGYCVFSGSTVEELAAKAGISAEGLTATLTQYNADVKAGKDSAFGRTKNLMAFEGETFYAVRTVPYILLTKGGVDINTAAEVLRADGSKVEGLYACGELIGGANIGGFGSIGGLAHSICFTWGTIAAETAVSRVLGTEVHVDTFRGVTNEVPAA